MLRLFSCHYSHLIIASFLFCLLAWYDHEAIFTSLGLVTISKAVHRISAHPLLLSWAYIMPRFAEYFHQIGWRKFVPSPPRWSTPHMLKINNVRWSKLKFLMHDSRFSFSFEVGHMMLLQRDSTSKIYLLRVINIACLPIRNLTLCDGVHTLTSFYLTMSMWFWRRVKMPLVTLVSHFASWSWIWVLLPRRWRS